LVSIGELVLQGHLVKEHLPSLEPVFFNLAATRPARLHSQAGALGWILHLFQQRRTREAAFRTLLRQAIGEVDRQTASERPRWQEMMWYVHALLYHERETDAKQLAEHVRQSVRSAASQEVTDMGKSYAEILQDEAAIKAKQDMLVRQLKKRFRGLPPAIEAQILATQDIARLDQWGEEFATAKKLSDISFDRAP
jgi:hypothetical protein